ncbi:mCG1041621, isoform CRA_b [Mus musculus]|nr:mCG1041621, isoform CRA_b [Mus musculus]
MIFLHLGGCLQDTAKRRTTMCAPGQWMTRSRRRRDSPDKTLAEGQGQSHITMPRI